MITELYDIDFPDVYNRLLLVFPDKPWKAIVRGIEQNRAQEPFRAVVNERDQVIPCGLTAWEKYGFCPPTPEVGKTINEAMLTAVQVVHLCEQMATSGSGPKGLPNRFRGALKTPADMRALKFELHMALVLYRGGCRIEWPEEKPLSKICDLLVTPPNLPTFELECKSFAASKGIVAPDDRVSWLYQLAAARLMGVLPGVAGMISVLTISVASPLPAKKTELERFVDCLLIEVTARSSGRIGLFDLKYDIIPLVPLSNAAEDQIVQVCGAADDALEDGSSLSVCWSLTHGGWQVLRVIGTAGGRLWKEVEKVAKEAINGQLTKKRPGAVALHFGSETADSLLEIAEQDHENLFRSLAIKLMKNPKHAHLAMMAFVSDSELNLVSESTTALRSTVYSFDSHWGTYPKLGLQDFF